MYLLSTSPPRLFFVVLNSIFVVRNRKVNRVGIFIRSSGGCSAILGNAYALPIRTTQPHTNHYIK